MNNFGLTVVVKRFDAAKKTGKLELIDRDEKFQLRIAQTRGPLDGFNLYCAGREPARWGTMGIQMDGDRITLLLSSPQ